MAAALGARRPDDGKRQPPSWFAATALPHRRQRLDGPSRGEGHHPRKWALPDAEFGLARAFGERASLIVTSNKPFGRWGEVFEGDVVAAAMIDRLVHHAEVISLKGDSYRLKDRDLGRVPAATKTND